MNYFDQKNATEKYSKGKLHKVIFICLGICFYFLAKSQTPYYKQLSTETKFPSNVIYDIYQDKLGFMWFGSEVGLIKFDGQQSTVFSTNKSSGKAVSNILESEDGTIWCQNFSGHFFFTRNDSLILKPEISTFGNYMPACMIQESILACFTKNSISLHNTQTKKTKTITLNLTGFLPSINSNSSTYNLFSPSLKKTITVDTSGKLNTKEFINVSPNSFFYTSINNQELVISKAKPIVLNYGTKVIKKDLSTLFTNRILNNVKIFDDKQIALLTSSGFCFISNTLNISSFYFENETTSSILKDNEGNIWLGTLNNGVYFIPHLSVKKYLTGNYTSKVYKGKERLFVGTSKNEIFIFDLKTGIKKTLTKDLAKHELKVIHQNPYNKDVLYCSDKFYHVTELGKKNNSEIMSVNAITQIDSTHYLLSESATLSIYPITKNDKWLNWAIGNGRYVFKKRLCLHKEYVRVKSAEYINDTIFSATTAGLYKYGKQITLQIFYNKQPIECFQLAKLGDSLIIATTNYDILFYCNGIVKPFITKKQGLGTSEIFSVKVFANKIYILNNDGIEVFSVKAKKLQTYSRSDGFLNIDVTDFIVDKDTLIAANIDGLITIPLNKSVINTSLPKLVFNQFYINQTKAIYKSNLELNHNQNFIEINFSLIDYRGSDYTKIYYSINNGKWIYLNAKNLSLNALETGKYEVKLKAINERGYECKKNLVFNFSIKPPFYKTWWFILFEIIAFLALLFLGFKYRIGLVKKKNKLLTEKMALEKALHISTLSSIKAQMNPHFIFNALNTIQSYIYLNDKKTAADYLVNFSELTRLILDMSNKEKVYLEEEIKALELYLKLEKMRFEEDFNYFIIKENLQSDIVSIPSMLIQPYVENAIKHGLLHKKGEKKLTIEFQQNNKMVTVIITDNGIGIEASKQINALRNKNHQSFATSANQKRFELLNKNNQSAIGVEFINLTNAQNQSIGTQVILNIPF